MADFIFGSLLTWPIDPMAAMRTDSNKTARMADFIFGSLLTWPIDPMATMRTDSIRQQEWLILSLDHF